MLLLGCVESASEFELIVNLPNGLHGYVQITDISAGLTRLAEHVTGADEADAAATDAPDAGAEQHAATALDLSRMFRCGQLVRCAVISLSDANDRPRILLSLDPSVVNKFVPAEAVVKGMVR